MSDQSYSTSGPLDQLFIYYLDGRLHPDSRFYAKAFLGNWEEDGFSFLFFSEPSDRVVAAILDDHPGITLIDQYQMSYMDWHGEAVKPFSVGCFVITPPWETPVPDENKQTLILDPGVVFGTGTHPTTHDCLEAIDALCYEENIDSILDLGTGTGLLAIAALKLGGCRALAVDFNFLAAKTALNNVALNHLENKMFVVHGRAEDFMDRPADLVISNIHYDVMQHLVRTDAFLKHKWFILSGLLRSQARNIMDILDNMPVQVIHHWEKGTIWHTFLGRVNQT